MKVGILKLSKNKSKHLRISYRFRVSCEISLSKFLLQIQMLRTGGWLEMIITPVMTKILKSVFCNIYDS